ncbi:MAG: hypothetical protein AB7Q42_14775 [Acidimicrobiia bacterium]
MKRSLYAAVAVTAAVMSFAACSDDDDNDVPGITDVPTSDVGGEVTDTSAATDVTDSTAAP